MPAVARLNYYRRIFSAYLGGGTSHLSFWHEQPEINPDMRTDALGSYYMLFRSKADYTGHLDADGIPMLDYHGAIGRQYNPIAIAQYGLANYNLYLREGVTARRDNFLKVANWLRDHLEQNAGGQWVWNHHFDWEYRSTLKSPWYSGLAQGQGISLLLRAHADTRNPDYLDAANRAFEAMCRPIAEGGVLYVDRRGDTWIEEYLVDPPTHILNGFMWASWGVHDYFLATQDPRARDLFAKSVATLVDNLAAYDTGYWSLYELSGTRLKMLASSFYHALHIVQLDVMHRLTGEAEFADRARRWRAYRDRSLNRRRALVGKALFKLCYY